MGWKPDLVGAFGKTIIYRIVCSGAIDWDLLFVFFSQGLLESQKLTLLFCLCL